MLRDNLWIFGGPLPLYPLMGTFKLSDLEQEPDNGPYPLRFSTPAKLYSNILFLSYASQRSGSLELICVSFLRCLSPYDSKKLRVDLRALDLKETMRIPFPVLK